MAIKARFPSGTNSIKLDALYQWDYGQELEIESEDLLSSIVEVHFSCSGMTEAIVHSASVLNGIATVRIPDACLEQTLNITAWVYEIDGTQGRTTKSITIPVVSRARPNRPAEIPQIVSDVYTQLITEVNEAVENLKTGDVIAKKAQESDKATVATSAETATRAISANVAESANIANTANTAGRAGILTHYDYPGVPDAPDSVHLEEPGVYLVKFKKNTGGSVHTVIIAIDDLHDGCAYHSASTVDGACAIYAEGDGLYIQSTENTSIIEVQQLIEYI